MTAAASELVIEVDQLSKRYGQLVAVDRLRLGVARHRVTGLVGQNGAGKTTTLKLLLGMISPSSGTARVLGHRIDDPAGSLAALAALPVVIVPLGTSLAGEHYAWAQALGFAWLWLTVGGLAFAATLVVSVVVPRSDAALVTALVGLRVVPSVAARLPGMSSLPRGLEGVMNGRGMAYFQADGHRLLYTPWALVALIACVCACTLWLAAWRASKDRQA